MQHKLNNKQAYKKPDWFVDEAGLHYRNRHVMDQI